MILTRGKQTREPKRQAINALAYLAFSPTQYSLKIKAKMHNQFAVRRPNKVSKQGWGNYSTLEILWKLLE